MNERRKMEDGRNKDTLLVAVHRDAVDSSTILT